MNKPKILHYYSSSTQIGGPLTYINTILKSELNKTYELNTCFQMMAPKGINIPLLIKMRDQIKGFAPNILHVHGLQSEGFYGLPAGRLALALQTQKLLWILIGMGVVYGREIQNRVFTTVPNRKTDKYNYLR